MLGTALRSLRWRKRDADGERVSLLDKHETSIDWDEEEAARPEWKPKVARSRRTAVMWEPTWQQDKRPHPPSRLAVLDLFRLRNRRDERRMLLAAVLSVCSGLMTPLPAVLFGQLVRREVRRGEIRASHSRVVARARPRLRLDRSRRLRRGAQRRRRGAPTRRPPGRAARRSALRLTAGRGIPTSRRKLRPLC